MPPRTRSGPQQRAEDDDAWSLSIEEDESHKESHLEQMTQELSLNATNSSSSAGLRRPQLPDRSSTAPAHGRPAQTRKPSASGIWNYLTRQSSAHEAQTPSSSTTHPHSPPPPTSHPPSAASAHHRKDPQWDAASLSPQRRPNKPPTTTDSPRSRASSASSSSEPSTNRHSWIHIDTNADASSALRGKAVALLTSEEMAAAVRLNVPDILQGTVSFLCASYRTLGIKIKVLSA